MNNRELANKVYRAVRQEAQSLLLRLENDQPAVREAAAEALGRLGYFEAASALIGRLDDSERAVRWAAIGALGDLQSSEAVPELVRLLRDRDHGTREATALALGEIGAETAIGPLVELLKDPSSQVRLTAIDALGQIGSTEALPALMEIANRSDVAERRCAEGAIELIRSSESELLAVQEDEATEPNLAEHPSLASFAAGIRGGWEPYQKEHVRECDFCQRLVAVEWSIRHPEFKILAAYSGDPLLFPYAPAMQRHLDKCRRCTLLLKSPLMGAVAALARFGKQLELAALSLQAPLPALQQMAPVQECVYAYENEGDSSLTLHESESHSLMVLADISPEGMPRDRVRVEIIGQNGYRALDSKVGVDFEVSSVIEAAREFGEDLVLLAAWPSHQSLKGLAGWLAESNEDLRLAAIQAIGALGELANTPEIVARLSELAKDEDERIREAAGVALTAIAENRD
jgi:HEAT repeat protein